MKSKLQTSPALQFVSHAWNSIPGGSWQRINSSMFQALRLAVESKMSFAPDDIKVMSNTMRLGMWIRSDDTEGLYAAACGGERGAANPSAVAAFEVYTGRKPYLWAEDTKTPTRLYVGARFTWKNETVYVTSFQGDHLIAVTDGERRKDIEYHDGAYRVVEMNKTLEDGTILIRYSPPVEETKEGTRHIFKVTHKELTETRKAYDTKRKAYEKEYSEAETLETVDAITARIVTEGRVAFRHFDIEILTTARQTAVKNIEEGMTPSALKRRQQETEKAEAADLARWMAGENVHRAFKEVKLRIVGNWVETSTMQRATVKSVRAAITWAAPHRKGWKEKSGQCYILDNYPVRSITSKGCQVGCTFVPWSEIDRITPELDKPSTKKFPK